MKMISCARAPQVLKVSLSAAASLAARPLVKRPLRLFDSRVRAFVVALAFVALTAPAASANCSPTSATEICLEHTLPTLPAAGGKFADPDFGTEIMRLTDASDDAVSCLTPYSYWPAFNRDATRVIATCSSAVYFYAFNPTTFTRGARTTYAGSPAMDFGSGYYWDKNNPDLIYAFASVNTKLYRYNVATGAQTVERDFASVLGAGRYVAQPSMSDDLSVIGFTVKNSADYSNYGYMVYNLATSTVLLYVNDTRVNEVHVSKNGQYASVDLDGPQAVRVWNLADTSSSQYLVYYDPAAPQNEGLSHNTTKSNYLVGFTAAVTSTVARWEFTNLQRTTLLPLSFTHTGTAHISGLQDDDNWCLVSISDGRPATVSAGYDASATTIAVAPGHGPRLPTNVQFDAVWWNQTDYPRGPASDPNREIVRVTNNDNDTLTVLRGQQGTNATPKNTPGKTYRLLPAGPFHGEIFLVKTDGSGEVRRFLHHRAQLIDYYDSNFGNISRDGRFVAFASNWDDSGRRDLFIARVPTASSPTGAEAVVWTNVANATTGSNGAISKTPNGSDWPPASAASSQSLTGGGYFEFYPNHNGAPNLYPMNVGLNSGDASTFEYYWAISSGYAMPYVNNVYKASTPVTTSDRLRVAVESGVVKFYKNAELVYTSDVAPAYPLKAYFVSGLDNAGLTSAAISTAGSTDANWVDLVKATTGAGGAIVKTPNSGDWPPASANTSQGLGGDGSFECVVNHNGAPNIYPINVGLNSGSTSTVEYYWAISSGYAMPYVGGVYKASTPLTTSDRLKIAVEGGVVKFYKNAELVYTSDVAPSFPLKGYFASGFDGVGLTGASFVGAN